MASSQRVRIVTPESQEARLEAAKETFVTFLDQDGNPIEGKHVIITINTVTNEVEDITVEDA